MLFFTGTASRLSRKSSYHHCTLLHSADRSVLATVLRPSCPGIHSNATPSFPSLVANLIDHAPMLQWEEILDALVHQYNAGTKHQSNVFNPKKFNKTPPVGQTHSRLVSVCVKTEKDHVDFSSTVFCFHLFYCWGCTGLLSTLVIC